MGCWEDGSVLASPPVSAARPFTRAWGVKRGVLPAKFTQEMMVQGQGGAGLEDTCAVSVRDFSPGEEEHRGIRQDYLCNAPPVYHVGKCVLQLDVLCCQIAHR